MKFEERLEKYQMGLLNDDDKAKIEEEIEKYKAIEVYLMNEEPSDMANIIKSYKGTSDKKEYIPNSDTIDNEVLFSKKIQRNVNKRFFKMGIIIALILIFFYIATMYVLPNAISLFYYNPQHHSDDTFYEDIYYDLKAITYLTEPGYESGFVNVEKQGYGKYKLLVFYKNLFTYEDELAEEYIIKNAHFGTRIKDFYGFDKPISQFYDNQTEFAKDRFMYGDKAENLSYLGKLSPVAYVATYVIFSEDISLIQLEEFQREYPKLQFSWVNVKTNDENDTDKSYLGFSPNVNSSYGDKILFDKFPYFQLNDWHYDQDAFTQSYPWSVGYAEHFKALLSYVANRGSAIDQLDFEKRITSSIAEKALEYINTNGISLQGMLIYGEAENLQAYLANENNVKDVFIKAVQTSMPNLMYRIK